MGVVTELITHVSGLHLQRTTNFRGDSLTVSLLPSSVPSPLEFDLCKEVTIILFQKWDMCYFDIACKSRIIWDCILLPPSHNIRCYYNQYSICCNSILYYGTEEVVSNNLYYPAAADAC
jgi:hypothetical protein